MSESGSKVVITGVSGLIGFHLADHLCRTEPAQTVVGIARSVNRNVEDLRGHPNFRFVAADVTAAPVLDQVLAGAHLVYHLAAQSAIFLARRDPVGDLNANVVGTLQVMLSAARARVPKVVYTSGGAVYQSQTYPREDEVGHTSSFYGASKLAAESYVRVASATLGPCHTILRLSRVYGPRMVRGAIRDLIQDFEARRPANMFAHPDSIFDFVYVRDVVSALVQAAGDEWDGVTANVGSGHGIRLRDLHAAFVARFGYSVPLHPHEDEPLVHVLVNDHARALGWQPRYSLEEGLDETLRYFLPGLCP